ncbi:hypothetical protein JB92DRAFT_2827791 [Gautieria morchelliformis]|nr:hypothetical protein JB92DRAFT_2827791 [Gautieria morchelliformis]
MSSFRHDGFISVVFHRMRGGQQADNTYVKASGKQGRSATGKPERVLNSIRRETSEISTNLPPDPDRMGEYTITWYHWQKHLREVDPPFFKGHDGVDTILAQIGEEITSLASFLQQVYGTFGFEFQLELSTRLEKYLREIETWNVAEKDAIGYTIQLSEALKKFHLGKWELKEGDGAFYGPKIDIKIRDAL